MLKKFCSNNLKTYIFCLSVSVFMQVCLALPASAALLFPETAVQSKDSTSSYADENCEGEPQSELVYKTVFFDDFNDNTISGEWQYDGNSVTEQNEIMMLDTTVTDRGPSSTSRKINVEGAEKIILSRKLKAGYGNNYFDGQFRVKPIGVSGIGFGVSYAQYQYSGWNEFPSYGVAIFRNGANSHVTADQGDVSERKAMIWDSWFDEKIVYDTITGDIEYHMNDELIIAYNVGPLPPSVSEIEISFGTWGWWTGHYQHFDDISVSIETRSAGVGKHFTGVALTDTSCSYVGRVTMDDVPAVDGEDEIGVFVKGQEGNEIGAIGACVVGAISPGTCFANVYGDDLTTSEKDGAAEGEELIFKFWDKSAGKEYTIPVSALVYVAEDMLIEPSIPPVWSASTTFGFLDIRAFSNEPPVLASIGAKSGKEDEEISIEASATDPDGDDLILSTQNLPEGAVFDPETGIFTWTPAYDAAGEHEIVFKVTDTGNPQLSDSETVVVSVSNVNRAPAINGPASVTADEGKELKVEFTGTDPDGDQMIFAGDDLPPGAALDPLTGVFTWTPSFDQAGAYLFTVRVADNGDPVLNESQDVTLVVDNVNRAPVLQAIGDQSIDEGCLLMFHVTATDPDGNSLFFHLDTSLEGAHLIEDSPNTKVFSLLPGFHQEGEYRITITVMDDGAPPMSSHETVSIKVNNSPKHFTDHIIPTPTSMDIYGVATIGMHSVEVNDEIAVFDSEGKLCGLAIVDTAGEFGPLHIYRDDETTADIKEGPVEGESLTIMFYDFSEDKAFEAGPKNFGQPVLQFASNQSFQVDLEAVLKQRIPLHSGWNLISFAVNKCFYMDDKPTVSMIEGIEYEQRQSIDDTLSSISGQYSYVRGFDTTGAKSYNLSPWSDMTYMAAGYGYWIKVNEDADFDENGLIYLEMEGTRISSDRSITLQPGWNLVGYLGNQVKYVEEIPDVHFPEDAYMSQNSAAEPEEFFPSIAEAYTYVRSFDQYGAKSFNLSPWSDLKYVGPGYGYWIKVKEGANPELVWGDE